jgi:hypothetical protein
LIDALPKELFAKAAPMWIKPISAVELAAKEEAMAAGGAVGSSMYDCPVYNTSDRRGAQYKNE